MSLRTSSLRSMALAVLLTGASAASSRPAAAADAVNPPSATAPVASSDVTPEPTAVDSGDFCRTHWFAVAECHDAPLRGPRIMFGLGLGVSKMEESGPFGFDTGVGTVTNAGPTWGLRAGLEIFSWLAVEGRYDGMHAPIHASASPAGSIGFLMSSVSLTVRLTAPLPYVHPYIFGGVGYYDLSLTGSSGAKAGSVFNSSSQAGIPLGFGLDVPLTSHLSVGAEATYHFQLGEDYSQDTTNGIDGGDISTFEALLRARL